METNRNEEDNAIYWLQTTKKKLIQINSYHSWPFPIMKYPLYKGREARSTKIGRKKEMKREKEAEKQGSRRGKNR